MTTLKVSDAAPVREIDVDMEAAAADLEVPPMSSPFQLPPRSSPSHSSLTFPPSISPSPTISPSTTSPPPSTRLSYISAFDYFFGDRLTSHSPLPPTSPSPPAFSPRPTSPPLTNLPLLLPLPDSASSSESLTSTSPSGVSMAPRAPSPEEMVYRTKMREGMLATLGSMPPPRGKCGAVDGEGKGKEKAVGGLRCLIVDDNDLNLRVLRHILVKRLPHFLSLPHLSTAASGPEALAHLATKDFDLVLLDISMPGMSGLEVCRRIREGDGTGVSEGWGVGGGLSEGDGRREDVLNKGKGKKVRQENRGIDVVAVTTDLADWQVDMYRRAGMNGVVGKPLKEQDIAYACQLATLTAHICSAGPSPTSPSSNSARASRNSFFAQARVPTPHAGHAKYPFFFRRHGREQLVPPFSDTSSESDSASGMSGSISGLMRLRRGSVGDKSGQRTSVSQGSESDVVGSLARGPAMLIVAAPERKDSSDTTTSSATVKASLPSVFSSLAGGRSQDVLEEGVEYDELFVEEAISPQAREPCISRPRLGSRQESYESQATSGSSVQSSIQSSVETPEAHSVFAPGHPFVQAIEGFTRDGQMPILRPATDLVCMGTTVDPLVSVLEGEVKGMEAERDLFEETFGRAFQAAGTPDGAGDEEKATTARWREDDVEGEEEGSTPSPRPQGPTSVFKTSTGDRLDDAWASITDPSPSNGSTYSRGGISNYTRHLLARRSHPMLSGWRASSNDLNMSLDLPPRRLTRSLYGSPLRPTHQLLQLGKEQSVLKDGDLLEEVLRDLDREDRAKRLAEEDALVEATAATAGTLMGEVPAVAGR